MVFLCQEASNQKLCLLTQAKYSLFCPEFMDYRKPDTGWDELKISIFLNVNNVNKYKSNILPPPHNIFFSLSNRQSNIKCHEFGLKKKTNTHTRKYEHKVYYKTDHLG